MSWKFWKKDDLALGDMGSSFGKSDLGLSSGLDLSEHFQPGSNASPMSSLPPPSTTFGQASYTPPSSFSPPPAIIPPSPTHEAMHDDSGVQKELEVIGAKLDTIRAQLEILNSRISNLEKAQQNSVPPSRRPWY